MINSLGIIQNNSGVTDLLKYLKSCKTQYKLLSKKEERDIVNKYVEVMKHQDGSDILDMTDPLYMDWAFETNEEKKKNLYYRVRRVLHWKKSQKEFCDLMVMHNIRFVFNISKDYCKNTRDYDNMIEKGLYGLVKAANRFNPFAPMTKPDPEDKNPDKKKRNKIVIFDEEGKIIPIKFCTYARNWIFKYIVEEFMDKTVIHIDNNSISLNDCVRIKNSVENKQTLENYVDNMISPDYIPQKSTVECLSSNETSRFYHNIAEYIKNTNELTALEKEIIVEAYYNGLKSREIAAKINVETTKIQASKAKALRKLKKYLIKNYNIKSVEEV